MIHPEIFDEAQSGSVIVLGSLISLLVPNEKIKGYWISPFNLVYGKSPGASWGRIAARFIYIGTDPLLSRGGTPRIDACGHRASTLPCGCECWRRASRVEEAGNSLRELGVVHGDNKPIMREYIWKRSRSILN